jgi:hypothetical protein
MHLHTTCPVTTCTININRWTDTWQTIIGWNRIGTISISISTTTNACRWTCCPGIPWCPSTIHWTRRYSITDYCVHGITHTQLSSLIRRKMLDGNYSLIEWLTHWKVVDHHTYENDNYYRQRTNLMNSLSNSSSFPIHHQLEYLLLVKNN